MKFQLPFSFLGLTVFGGLVSIALIIMWMFYTPISDTGISTLPIVLNSRLQADYSQDKFDRPLAPLNVNIITEIQQDLEPLATPTPKRVLFGTPSLRASPLPNQATPEATSRFNTAASPTGTNTFPVSPPPRSTPTPTNVMATLTPIQASTTPTFFLSPLPITLTPVIRPVDPSATTFILPSLSATPIILPTVTFFTATPIIPLPTATTTPIVLPTLVLLTSTPDILPPIFASPTSTPNN